MMPSRTYIVHTHAYTVHCPYTCLYSTLYIHMLIQYIVHTHAYTVHCTYTSLYSTLYIHMLIQYIVHTHAYTVHCPYTCLYSISSIHMLIQYIVHTHAYTVHCTYLLISSLRLFSDFCPFCVVIWFHHPATTANDLQFRRISIPNFIHYFFVLS